VSKKNIFAVASPLGYRVVLTRNRWREITRFKHPALKGHEGEVKKCVHDPLLITESKKDPNVHLYYRQQDDGFLCVVVSQTGKMKGFVVTGFFTSAIKTGSEVWKK